MKKYYIIFIILPLVSNLFSQDKTFNNWHFGNNCGITFNTNPPSFLNNSRIFTDEGSASISDSLGNLLFYTDGRYVYDKTNTQMPNGFGLFGHISSTQSALIVPNPQKKNIYYVFTTDAVGFASSSSCGGCFSYSTIDVNLNSGLGDIVSKNIFLASPMTEKITGYKNPNDSLIWVVTHEYNTNNFHVYKVDSNGVNPTPVITNIGIGNTVAGLNSANGQMKISPDGTKIAYCILANGYLELFDFNSSTGQISNPVSVQTGLQEIYGLEFSPNSKLIYITDNTYDTKVKQYSLLTWTSSAILNSGITLDNMYSSNYLFSQIQLAPNGKIYISKRNFGLYVINNPDVRGTGCDYTHSGINFSVGIYGPSVCKFGLPNYIPGYYKTNYNPEVPESIIEECNDVIIPNVITPNDDHVNDQFTISCHSDVFEPTDLTLYNRWGLEVYNTSKKSKNLADLADGTYFYTFTYNDIKHKGHVLVLH